MQHAEAQACRAFSLVYRFITIIQVLMWLEKAKAIHVCVYIYIYIYVYIYIERERER